MKLHNVTIVSNGRGFEYFSSFPVNISNHGIPKFATPLMSLLFAAITAAGIKFCTLDWIPVERNESFRFSVWQSFHFNIRE